MKEEIPLTLAGNWQSYFTQVVEPNNSKFQRDQMEAAFHAGFIRAFEVFATITEMDEIPQRVLLQALENEILQNMLDRMTSPTEGKPS